MLKIISKQPHHSGFEGFNIETSDGKKWSVRDFGGKKWKRTYEIYPKFVYESTYKGWEAYNGNSDEIIRADSYEKIELEILNK